MEKKINSYDEPKYIVFATEPDAMLQEALIQQSNPIPLENAKNFAKNYKGTCYIFKQIEQHYEPDHLN